MCLVRPALLCLNVHVLKVFCEQINQHYYYYYYYYVMMMMMMMMMVMCMKVVIGS